MQPSYRVQIDVCLSKPVSADAIWLRRIQHLPFVPLEGMILRVTSEDEESTFDLTMENVVYDTHAGMFLVDIDDQALIIETSEKGSCDAAALIAQYAEFGFTRLNFPVAQAVRA